MKLKKKRKWLKSYVSERNWTKVNVSEQNWTKVNLSERKQWIFYSDVDKTSMRSICGVPQGFVIRPLLFLIYINDLHNASSVLKLVILADDTNLFLSNEDVNKLFKVKLSPSKKFFLICLNYSPSKTMKNAFYFILKALFVLKIFKYLSWLLVI